MLLWSARPAIPAGAADSPSASVMDPSPKMRYQLIVRGCAGCGSSSMLRQCAAVSQTCSAKPPVPLCDTVTGNPVLQFQSGLSDSAGRDPLVP